MNLVEEAGRAAVEERQAFQGLVRLLYDEDLTVRHRAAAALGVVARIAPDRTRALPERLAWAMNDESGMTCRGAPAAIAEIGVARPDLARGFVPVLVSHLDDDGQLEAILWAAGTLARAFPAEVAAIGPALDEFLKHPRPAVRAMAVRALARARHFGPGEPFWDLLADTSEVEYWDCCGMVRQTVREVAIRELVAPG